MFSDIFSENPVLYVITWKDMVQPGRLQMKITRCMCIACCISKATNTHHQYVVLIALQRQQRQQRLHERVSILRYTYIASRALYRFNCYLVSVQFNIQVVTTPTSIQTVMELMDKSSQFSHICT
jgi:hypothetical protein